VNYKQITKHDGWNMLNILPRNIFSNTFVICIFVLHKNRAKLRLFWSRTIITQLSITTAVGCLCINQTNKNCLSQWQTVNKMCKYDSAKVEKCDTQQCGYLSIDVMLATTKFYSPKRKKWITTCCRKTQCSEVWTDHYHWQSSAMTCCPCKTSTHKQN